MQQKGLLVLIILSCATGTNIRVLYIFKLNRNLNSDPKYRQT